MTKADLVEQVTNSIAKTSGPMISKKDCARVVDAFLDSVKDALKNQQNIEIRGFGTFKIRRRKTRMARNPRTGDPVEVAARPVPVFKPSKELRALVADEEENPSEPVEPRAQGM
jgi:integration host factor subunit beta